MLGTELDKREEGDVEHSPILESGPGSGVMVLERPGGRIDKGRHVKAKTAASRVAAPLTASPIGCRATELQALLRGL